MFWNVKRVDLFFIIFTVSKLSQSSRPSAKTANCNKEEEEGSRRWNWEGSTFLVLSPWLVLHLDQLLFLRERICSAFTRLMVRMHGEEITTWQTWQFSCPGFKPCIYLWSDILALQQGHLSSKEFSSWVLGADSPFDPRSSGSFWVLPAITPITHGIMLGEPSSNY